MTVIFRTDASLKIGTGHIMRCLTLAKMLKTKGVESKFISRPHDGSNLEHFEEYGFEVLKLPKLKNYTNDEDSDKELSHSTWLGTDWKTDADDTIKSIGNLFPDLLIVDHYAIDERWETKLKSYCNKLMVIDDLANRKHNCDLLLDQTPGRSVDSYNKLLNDSAKTIIGPKYIMLRPEFSRLRFKKDDEDSTFKIFIAIGSIDTDNIINHILKVIEKMSFDSNVIVYVTLSKYAPHLKFLKNIAIDMRIKVIFLIDEPNIAEYMAESDMAISAGGLMSYELVCLGIPSIIIPLSNIQLRVANQLATIADLRVLNSLPDNPSKILTKEISSFVRNIKSTQFNINKQNEIDGLGTKRVVDAIMNI